MRPLRYSINVTLDGCCDHREGVVDEELHDHAAENLARADALLFGRVTYEMMETQRRSTSCRAPWNRSTGTRSWCAGICGRPSSSSSGSAGEGLLVGGVKLPLALAELGLIDEYEFVVQPRLAGHGRRCSRGCRSGIDLKLVSRLEFGSGAVAMRYEPRR